MLLQNLTAPELVLLGAICMRVSAWINFLERRGIRRLFYLYFFNRTKLLVKQTAGSNTGPPHIGEKEKAATLCRICCPHLQLPKLLLPQENRGGRSSVVMW